MSPTACRVLLGLHSWGGSHMFVPELFARTGMPVDAVMTPEHHLRGVRGVSQTFVSSESEWAAAVERRLLTGDYIRFFNVDEVGLEALYRHTWHADAVRFLPFAPGSAVAATVNSKRAFYDWCLSHGLPIPETHSCANFAEACALHRVLEGDWLLKGDRGCSGATVMRSSAYRRAQPEISDAGPWLVQRDEGAAVGSAIFLADQGQLLGWIATKNLVRLSEGFGVTILGQGDPCPDVGELCKRIAEASGVSGLTGFDFVRGKDRGPLLIDSHLGRMCPMQHFDRLYGVDFAALLRAHLDGRSFQVAAPRDGPGFVKFPEVIDLILEGGILKLRKGVRPLCMPVAPKGDLFMGLRLGFKVLVTSSRVGFGRWRRERYGKI